MTSIGAHVYGRNFNSASVIGGQYGNPYAAYISLFDVAKPKKSLHWLPLNIEQRATVSGFV